MNSRPRIRPNRGRTSSRYLVVVFPAAALLPQFSRTDGRHENFLRTGAVHLLANDGFDLAHNPQAQGKKIINTARDLADHAGPHQQAMTDDFGVSRILAECRDQRLTVSHKGIVMRKKYLLGGRLDSMRQWCQEGCGCFLATLL